MAKAKKKQKPQPSLRIADGKRINLADLRARRQAARAEPKPPVEDDRVSAAWERNERREAAQAKLQQERQAMKTARAPKLETEAVQKPNPDWTPGRDGARAFPRKTPALVNLRESTVEWLAARGFIDDIQNQAADRFRKLWEQRWTSVRAMDYSRDKVDAASAPTPIRDIQINARRELEECRALIGNRAFDLVANMCVAGHSLTALFPGKRDRLTAMDNLKAALDDLAERWNLGRRTVTGAKRC